MNSIGTLFKVTTWGESHGKALGAVIDGCPAGIELDEQEITDFLSDADRPLPELATQRIEDNKVKILSGVSGGVTLGTPICLVINNTNKRSGDYSNIQGICRPGHGDYSYLQKYKLVQQSGGGRASGRECISRVAAGFLAGKVIVSAIPEYSIKSKICSLSGKQIDSARDMFWAVWAAKEAAKEFDSTGGEVELSVSGFPAGIGCPVFAKLDAQIASAVMGIGGVKSVEIGLGKQAALTTGSKMNDQFSGENNSLLFRSNNAGGVLAGVSTGQDLVIKFAVKPTPSIQKKQMGIRENGQPAEIEISGRHDANFTPRAAIIAEAMINMVLLDQLMICGRINRDCI